MDNTYITELDEKQLDELLAYVPDYSIKNAENIKTKFLQKTTVKRKHTKRFFLTAAAVVTMLALSITALAATGIINLGRFYDSIFANPEASPYVVTGEGLSIVEGDDINSVPHAGDIITGRENSNDLSVEPVAAFLDGWQIYVQLKVTVQNDVPLPDALYIFNGNTPLNYGDVDITRINEKSAFISFMTVGNHVTFLKDGSSVLYHTPEWEQADTVILRFDSINSDYHEADIIYNGPWEISIYINNETVNKINPGFIETSYMGFYTTVAIRATSFEVRVFAAEGVPFYSRETYWIDGDLRVDIYYDDNDLPKPSFESRTGDVVITLSDGRTVEPIIDSTSNDDTLACYSYIMDFINPEDVVSVMFFGVELIR